MTAMSFNPLFAKFLNHCRRIAPPGPWARHVDDYDVWHPPHDSDGTMKALEDKFGRDLLVESGLVVTTAGRPEFNPDLFGMPNQIFPLRMLPELAPYNLITTEGNVRDKLSQYAFASDYRVRSIVAQTGTLFLAEHLGDVGRLRALGLAVAPVCGLESLTSEKVRDFRMALGQSTGYPQFAVVQHLVLIGWSPTTYVARCPRIIHEVAQSLREAAGCLGLPQQNVLLWQPTFEDLFKLGSCLTLGTRQDALEAISSSLKSSSRPLCGTLASGPVGGEFLAAEKKLRAVLRAPDAGRRRRRQGLRRLEQLTEARLVKPIFDAAQETADPIERIRLYALAQAARTLSLSSTMHQAKLESEIITHGLNGDGADLDLNGLIKSLEAVIKLCKEED